MDYTTTTRTAFASMLYTALTRDGTTEEKKTDSGTILTYAIYRTGCGFDTESTTITGTKRVKIPGGYADKPCVLSCFCYSWQTAINGDYSIYRTREDFFAWLHTVIDVVKRRNEDTGTNARFIIWAANLAHEWAFIKSDFANRFNITRVFAKSERDVLQVVFDDCVELRECIGLFGHSLADIAKNWTTTQKLKGDLDYNKVRLPGDVTPLTEEERQYCINDVIILTEMHRAIIKHYTRADGTITIPYTSSGFVRQKLKEYIHADEDITTLRDIKNSYRAGKGLKLCETNTNYLMLENRKIFVSETQWKLCRAFGFAGGLCGSNFDYVGKEISTGVVCADITSDYPAQLTQQKYPSGRLRNVSPELFTQAIEQKRPLLAVLRIDSIKSKSAHATFSKHKLLNGKDNSPLRAVCEPSNVIEYNGKLWQADNIIICINDIDWKAYNEIYNISGVQCLRLWVFDKYKRLPEWLLKSMWDDYETKALLKRDGLNHTQEYKDAKRNVNTYYGVLAQKSRELFESVNEFGELVAAAPETWEQERAKVWLNPYIAFWCTSYARALLMHFISRYPECIVQYDTDSLYYDVKHGTELEKAMREYNAGIVEKNRKIFREHPHAEVFEDLGTWDFDEPYTRFLALGAKKYIKQSASGEIETVIAGLPKTAIPSEIAAKKINRPFRYYNPLRRFIDGDDAKIIIEHMFAGKFASVYDDTPYRRDIKITDYFGNTAAVSVGSYHAILPIDFTLSMAKNYLKYLRER